MPVIRKKEERPEAADHSKSKTRNQRWIDFLRSTGVVLLPSIVGNRFANDILFSQQGTP